MRLFDTHAHYDSGAFNADRLEVLASMPEAGVELILNPGCDLPSSQTAVELAEKFPFVWGPPLRLRGLFSKHAGRPAGSGRPPQGARCRRDRPGLLLEG